MCVTFYKGADGFYRWHVQAEGNNRIVACSGESFANLWNAKRSFFSLYKKLTTGELEVKYG